MPEEIEETQTPHPDYVKGFNEGYILSKHLPDLAAKMPDNLSGERGAGFTQGRQQHMKEQLKDKFPFLANDRLGNLRDAPPSPSKGKGHDGPDR